MYKTQNGWTKQSMIEHIKKEFKGKSVKNDGSCLYRGPNGTKCAVGMFLTDEQAKLADNNEINGERRTSIRSVSFNHSDFLNCLPLELEGLEALQSIHDRSFKYTSLKDILNFVNDKVED